LAIRDTTYVIEKTGIYIPFPDCVRLNANDSGWYIR